MVWNHMAFFQDEQTILFVVSVCILELVRCPISLL
jgi:hypothetical protein